MPRAKPRAKYADDESFMEMVREEIGEAAPLTRAEQTAAAGGKEAAERFFKFCARKKKENETPAISNQPAGTSRPAEKISEGKLGKKQVWEDLEETSEDPAVRERGTGEQREEEGEQTSRGVPGGSYTADVGLLSNAIALNVLKTRALQESITLGEKRLAEINARYPKPPAPPESSSKDA